MSLVSLGYSFLLQPSFDGPKLERGISMIRAAQLKTLIFLAVLALCAFALTGTASADGPTSATPLPPGWTWDDGVAVSPRGWTWDDSGALTSPDGWTWDDANTVSSPLGRTYANETTAVPLQLGWTWDGADVALPNGWTWDDGGTLLLPSGWTWDNGQLTPPS
jgi:hypothetical protein